MPDTKYDPVNHPAHYTQYAHEVIELTEQLDFCLGNAVKYILRAPYKGNKIQDWEKAVWYLKRWELNNRENLGNGRTFDASMRELADTYDDKCLTALFRSRTTYDGVMAAIDFLETEIDFATHEALEKENEALKAQLAAVTAERDRLREQLNRKPAEPIPPMPIERYAPSYASGRAEGVEYGV